MDDGQRGTTAGVMNNVPDDALDVAVPLAVVNGSEPWGAFPVFGVGLENGPGAFSLSPDYSTHYSYKGKDVFHVQRSKRKRKSRF